MVGNILFFFQNRFYVVILTIFSTSHHNTALTKVIVISSGKQNDFAGQMSDVHTVLYKLFHITINTSFAGNTKREHS